MIILFWLLLLAYAINAGLKFNRKKYLGGALYILLPPLIAIITTIVILKQRGNPVNAMYMKGVLFEIGIGAWAMFVGGLIGLIQITIHMIKKRGLQKTSMAMGLLVLAAGIAGYSFHYNSYEYFKVEILDDNSRNIANDDPDFELTAEELTSAFAANETEATEKYIDEVLLVKGRLIKRFDDLTEELNVYLAGHNEEARVVMIFPEDYKGSDEFNKQMEGLSDGQMVSVKGWCNGSSAFDVMIRDCVFE